MRVDVLGVGFDNVTMDEAVSRAVKFLEGDQARYVVTPNPEIVEVCRENPAARAAVNGASGWHRRHQGRGHAGNPLEGKNSRN